MSLTDLQNASRTLSSRYQTNSNAMRNILITKQLRVLKERDNETIEETINRDNDKGTLAATVIDLLEVTGVAESVENDGTINEDQAILMYGEGEVCIESPYEEVAKQWAALVAAEDEPAEEKPLDLGVAVDRLTTALDTDPGLYEGYKANLEVSIRQAFDFLKDNRHLFSGPPNAVEDYVIQRGAKNFLDLFIGSSKIPTP